MPAIVTEIIIPSYFSYRNMDDESQYSFITPAKALIAYANTYHIFVKWTDNAWYLLFSIMKHPSNWSISSKRRTGKNEAMRKDKWKQYQLFIVHMNYIFTVSVFGGQCRNIPAYQYQLIVYSYDIFTHNRYSCFTGAKWITTQRQHHFKRMHNFGEVDFNRKCPTLLINQLYIVLTFYNQLT